jgi:hypothetical protein
LDLLNSSAADSTSTSPSGPPNPAAEAAQESAPPSEPAHATDLAAELVRELNDGLLDSLRSPEVDSTPATGTMAGSINLRQRSSGNDSLTSGIGRVVYHPATPENSSIPKPLADPLRSLRTGLIWLNALGILFFGVMGLWWLSQGNVAAFAIIVFFFVISLPGFLWLYGVTRLLPNRPTDILYLRAFRKDHTTGGIRTSLERVLDPQFRVSGIRDPKRRGTTVVRFAAYVLFIMKYLNPKYLNLEAGDEWKARLWRSLGEAKGVVIDFDEVTLAVKAEIRLCAKCMSLQRVLFVVRESEEPELWRDRIHGVLGSHTDPRQIQIATWRRNSDGSPSREFDERVAEFAHRLPEKPAGFDHEARTLAEGLTGQVFHESNTRLGIEIAVGLILSLVISNVINYWKDENSPFILAVMPFFLVWYILLWIHYISFSRNTGSRNRRKIARWTVLPLLIAPPATALTIALLIPAVMEVREAADRAKSQNNLKQLGLAMVNYEGSWDHLPGANAPFSNNPGQQKEYPVSWRVLLLPFIEELHLYRQYRFDEPWDEPNNVKFLKQMPKVYRHPEADTRKVPEGYTHYRVFASRPGTQPSALFLDGLFTPKMLEIPDGRPNTILITEAEEAVPWTMPEALHFDPSQPLPKLGGQFKRGYNVLMADGKTRFVLNNLPEDKLRAWITRDGGETVTDDK